jgi:hypothetical protein
MYPGPSYYQLRKWIRHTTARVVKNDCVCQLSLCVELTWALAKKAAYAIGRIRQRSILINLCLHRMILRNKISFPK